MTLTTASTLTGSNQQQTGKASLFDVINAHNQSELASFHTPGHKGVSSIEGAQNAWLLDVTELPGLDQLDQPTSVLLDVERRAAKLWGAAQSFISVNGASAGIISAILACAQRGKKILLPRNAHRSAVHAMVLSGLEPVWYEPNYDKDWHCYGTVDVTSFAQLLNTYKDELACALVVSPTYEGVISNIKSLGTACRANSVPLIVDEAQGSHFLDPKVMPPSAILSGCDLVVHSLHKTLGALTQTGLVHVAHESLVEPHAVRAALNLLQSSSPSYLLMTSIELAIAELERPETLSKLGSLRAAFDQHLNKCVEVKTQSPGGYSDHLHILVRMKGLSNQVLFDTLCQRGYYPEALLNAGVLLLLGTGNTAEQCRQLSEILSGLASCSSRSPEPCVQTYAQPDNLFADQHIPPRTAFFARSEIVPSTQAVGRVAAECIAPCPPGVPVIVPGARITEQAIAVCKSTFIKVVVESN